MEVTIDMNVYERLRIEKTERVNVNVVGVTMSMKKII